MLHNTNEPGILESRKRDFLIIFEFQCFKSTIHNGRFCHLHNSLRAFVTYFHSETCKSRRICVPVAVRNNWQKLKEDNYNDFLCFHAGRDRQHFSVIKNFNWSKILGSHILWILMQAMRGFKFSFKLILLMSCKLIFKSKVSKPLGINSSRSFFSG